MISKEEYLLSVVQVFYPNQIGTGANQLDKEMLLCVLSCLVEGEYPVGYLELKDGGLWATTGRLLFITYQVPLFGGKWKVAKQIEFPYNQIISVDFSSGGLFDRLVGTSFVGINMAGRKMVCETNMHIKTPYVPNFVELVRKNIKTASSNSIQVSQPGEEPDLVAQLERLNKLRTSGAISDEEYILAKAKILHS